MPAEEKVRRYHKSRIQANHDAEQMNYGICRVYPAQVAYLCACGQYSPKCAQCSNVERTTVALQ